MENYCIKVVEGKMSKFGQKKREAKKSNRSARKELLSESFEEEEYKIVEPTYRTKKDPRQAKRRALKSTPSQQNINIRR